MLKSLKVAGFAGVPYLETSQLMQTHGGKVKFSTSKPNVIVGPNGAGKSALLRAIAVRFLATRTGVSALDPCYTSDRDYDAFWKEKGCRSFEFCPGLSIETDNGPAMFYSPQTIPGEEPSVVHAIMTGYDREAHAYAALTEHKSMGQQAKAVLDRMLNALQGEGLPVGYGTSGRWFGSTEPKTQKELDAQGFVGSYDHKKQALCNLFHGATGVPLLVFDEPEQSLDAKAELELWKAIEGSDPKAAQVIVATHSLYPMLNPRRFNLIETKVGYAAEVRQLLGENPCR